MFCKHQLFDFDKSPPEQTEIRCSPKNRKIKKKTKYRNQKYLFSILGMPLGQSWLKSWLRLNSQLPPFTEYIMMPCNKKLKSLSHNKLTRHKESADLINDMGNRKGLELLA